MMREGRLGWITNTLPGPSKLKSVDATLVSTGNHFSRGWGLRTGGEGIKLQGRDQITGGII